MWVQNTSAWSLAEEISNDLDIISNDLEIISDELGHLDIGKTNIFESDTTEVMYIEDNTGTMCIDSPSPEKTAAVATMLTPNFVANKRSRTTSLTPKRLIGRRPRGQTSPNKVPIACRCLEF